MKKNNRRKITIKKDDCRNDNIEEANGGKEERGSAGIKSLKPYLLLWSTQSLSGLGSGMTSYALVLWLYLRTGSALGTALLSVCSYAPYVAMSIFAGAGTRSARCLSVT